MPTEQASLAPRPSAVQPVSLADVAAHLGVDAPASATSVAITGTSLTSGGVRPGDLYVAVPGARTHGARFADAAADAGAVAILTDREGTRLAAGSGLPMVVTEESPRSVLGSLAAYVYGDPAADLTLVGVTGTQGKTTVTHLANAGLCVGGRRTAVIGTMGTWIAGRPVRSSLTTPEATDLHALFAVMREEDVEVCAMEVSSHALVLGRVDGVVFDLAVFTNFGRDHLDFHRDLDDYFDAKAGLFTPQRARRALLNVDDPAQRSLVERPLIPTRTFSPSGAEADWRCEDVTMTADGARFTLAGPDLRTPVTIALPGEFNVANALCALAIVGEAGYDVEAASDGLAAVGSVPGRMETIDNDLGITVVVDYAHKPDAIKAVLATLRPVTPGRLIVVLGAGGDRDAGKRPIMGEYAAAMADIVVVTDDNPRSEDPARIRAEILAGVKGPGEARDLGDRRRAIHEAVEMAAPGDTVLIAGKGHETGQEVAGEVLAFDDREVARDAVTARTAALGGQP